MCINLLGAHVFVMCVNVGIIYKSQKSSLVCYFADAV